MTSGLDNLSLALFTALAPAGVVAFIVLALARIFAADHDRAVRIDRIIALPFAVALLGFIASATHLGTPANALHVFAGVGTSPLSNEVLAAVVFLVLTGSYWMAAFKVNFPDALAKPWLIVACLAGIALLGCTSQAYAVRTVPTWNTPYTPANLLLAGLFEGAVLSQIFLTAAKVPLRRSGAGLTGLAAGGLVANIAVMVAQNTALGTIANNEFTAATLAPHYALIIAFYALAGLAAVALDGWALRTATNERARFIARIIAGVLAFCAVFAGRIVFYNLHMTVGF
ncbi:DmsC/YnfH family molybdoenzyme membrane anchor subunit [Adlercreutzia sp. R21]|uniref:dimethyl sulfoxide reductase anchor subunit family protein n=1 Tax=Adlercreutzia wanghongyangiae TaxID=3111451 RepID=UPI002DB65C11|nr:DmsC/YnfH family molybdoenzyme membrane anchor subunit [Adlercreutzia sp. R21]MEC4185218.1 DmsC/YnfH family molybdoenzyme membrane anchor subunit [Adlercreutzia sp. R21]